MSPTNTAVNGRPSVVMLPSMHVPTAIELFLMGGLFYRTTISFVRRIRAGETSSQLECLDRLAFENLGGDGFTTARAERRGLTRRYRLNFWPTTRWQRHRPGNCRPARSAPGAAIIRRILSGWITSTRLLRWPKISACRRRWPRHTSGGQRSKPSHRASFRFQLPSADLAGHFLGCCLFQ
jgi:hypothetical protein